MIQNIKWKSVIPNIKEGDIITTFSSVISRLKFDCGWLPYLEDLEELATVKRKDNHKVGVYDKNGVQIIPEEFDECRLSIYYCSDFLVCAIEVQKQGMYGLYSEGGRVIVPVQYRRVDIQGNIIVVVDKNNLYGAYTTRGEQIINCEYDHIDYIAGPDIGCGCAVIRKDKLYGALAEDGSEIIPLKYGKIESEHMGSGGYIVYDETKSQIKGWYSYDGRDIIPCVFQSIKFDMVNPHFEVETPSKLKGIYSREGKEILPPRFKQLKYVGDFIVGLSEDNNLCVYNWQGTCLDNIKE